MPKTAKSPQDELLKGTLEMLILKSLTVQSMHGYAIVQHIARLSNGVFAVDHGSLYPALATADEWLGHRKVGRVPDKRRARYYDHRIGPAETG
jgi:DNA-binding PadR family transcriptional regulator